MLTLHFYAIIPLLILLVISLIFYGKGLVHLLTLSYCLVLGMTAIINQWETIFFPLIVFTGIIAIISFMFSMARGNWL
jgi:hypothetical protein